MTVWWRSAPGCVRRSLPESPVEGAVGRASSAGAKPPTCCITLDTYSHLLPDMQESAGELLASDVAAELAALEE